MRHFRFLITMAFACLLLAGLPTSLAYAQSSSATEEEDKTDLENTKQDETSTDNPAEKAEPVEEKQESEQATSDIAVPEVSYDLAALPFPTRRMHELILEATKSGDMEKLRALIGVGDSATQLSLGGIDGDPVEFLKSQSGDDDGYEILAILEEVLESGYVRMDEGTEYETYVWPYFFAMPIDKLTPQQMVELFRIVTYGDFMEFKDFGGYIFYRVGISPTGRWQFFVAGD